MPKVIVTPSSIFSPIGVRLLLGEIGVLGPMLQDETTITCVMTEAQIERFRNGRGAAHKLEIVPDAPLPIVEENTFVEEQGVSIVEEPLVPPPVAVKEPAKEKATENSPDPPKTPGPKKVA